MLIFASTLVSEGLRWLCHCSVPTSSLEWIFVSFPQHPLQMRQLRLREGQSTSQSCTAPKRQRWDVNMGSSNSRAQRRSHVCSEPSVPHCFLLVLSLASFPPAPRTPSPHLVFGLPSSGHTSLSSFQRRGPTGRPAHVRKFQPREPTQARDSEQPVALEETETWLSVGGVVTGDLKSCHFLGSPEGTGRS